MVERGGREGQQLGNYKLIHLLGTGGFADVYLGEHVHLNTLAAIKVLRTQLVADDITNFRNEALGFFAPRSQCLETQRNE